MRVFELLNRPRPNVPPADVEFLLAHVLGLSRGQLQASRDDYVEWDDLETFNALIERRARGEPVAYLLGQWEFWSLPLKVTRDVLVPRPETELLVEWAVELARKFPPPPSAGEGQGGGVSVPNRPHPSPPPSKTGEGVSILDLGTGSGCIALALAKELPRARITATDVSDAALAVARENAAALKLDERIEFLHGSWFEPIGAKRCFDLIVSNPPYIAERDPHLIDLRHEPRTALVGGWYGTEEIDAIVRGATRHLEPGGWLLIEHGHDQGEAVRKRLAKSSVLAEPQTRKDLEGRERVTGAQRPA